MNYASKYGSLQESRGSVDCNAPKLYVKFGKLPSLWSLFSFIGTKLIILHEVVMYFSLRFFNCSPCALFWVVSKVKHAHWNTNYPSHCAVFGSSLHQSTFIYLDWTRFIQIKISYNTSFKRLCVLLCPPCNSSLEYRYLPNKPVMETVRELSSWVVKCATIERISRQ